MTGLVTIRLLDRLGAGDAARRVDGEHDRHVGVAGARGHDIRQQVR